MSERPIKASVRWWNNSGGWAAPPWKWLSHNLKLHVKLQFAFSFKIRGKYLLWTLKNKKFKKSTEVNRGFPWSRHKRLTFSLLNLVCFSTHFGFFQKCFLKFLFEKMGICQKFVRVFRCHSGFFSLHLVWLSWVSADCSLRCFRLSWMSILCGTVGRRTVSPAGCCYHSPVFVNFTHQLVQRRHFYPSPLRRNPWLFLDSLFKTEIINLLI